MTLLITNVYVLDGYYSVTCDNGESAIFTRTTGTDVLGLPLWSSILADLIDTHGTALEGKYLVITSTSITVVAELQ